MTSERIRKALISAVQKQIAKPVYGYIAWDEIMGACPSCHHTFKRTAAYCPYCGQKLKWETPISDIAGLTSTVFREINLGSPCDTIQVDNASNADAKVEVSVPTNEYDGNTIA